MGLKQRFFKEDLKQLTEVEWLTETGSWFQKEHWPLDFVQKDGQGSNNTRTEKDALNLCLEGPTKKVPGFLCVFYIIYMVGGGGVMSRPPVPIQQKMWLTIPITSSISKPTATFYWLCYWQEQSPKLYEVLVHRTTQVISTSVLSLKHTNTHLTPR